MHFSELTVDLSPEELIRLRFTALEERNFTLLYASYHPQAPFLEQFADAASYLEYARQSLSDIRLCELHVGGSRTTPEGIEQLCALRFELGGQALVLYEMALLIETKSGWRYHSAQKLSAEDFQGEFATLDFSHFDQQDEKIRF